MLIHGKPFEPKAVPQMRPPHIIYGRPLALSISNRQSFKGLPAPSTFLAGPFSEVRYL